MAIILTIDHRDYLVKNDKMAMDCLRALTGAVVMDYHYTEHRKVYWPRKERPTEISITTVLPDQILAKDPREVDAELPRKIKQIGNG